MVDSGTGQQPGLEWLRWSPEASLTNTVNNRIPVQTRKYPVKRTQLCTDPTDIHTVHEKSSPKSNAKSRVTHSSVATQDSDAHKFAKAELESITPPLKPRFQMTYFAKWENRVWAGEVKAFLGYLHAMWCCLLPSLQADVSENLVQHKHSFFFLTIPACSYQDVLLKLLILLSRLVLRAVRTLFVQQMHCEWIPSLELWFIWISASSINGGK